MKVSGRWHPGEVELDRYQAGVLTGWRRTLVARHLGKCASCRKDLEKIRALDGLFSELKRGGGAPSEVVDGVVAAVLAACEEKGAEGAGAWVPGMLWRRGGALALSLVALSVAVALMIWPELAVGMDPAGIVVVASKRLVLTAMVVVRVVGALDLALGPVRPWLWTGALVTLAGCLLVGWRWSAGEVTWKGSGR